MEQVVEVTLGRILQGHDVSTVAGRRDAYQAVAYYIRDTPMAEWEAHLLLSAATTRLQSQMYSMYELRRRNWRVPPSAVPNDGAPDGTTVAIVWSPEVLSPEEYGLVVRALADIARAHGAEGLARLASEPAVLVRDPAIGVTT